MNDNTFGLSDEQINNLLGQVSNNMGISKQALYEGLQSGQLDGLMAQNQSPQKAQIMQMMQNKELMDRFLASDEAVEYLKKLSKEL